MDSPLSFKTHQHSGEKAPCFTRQYIFHLPSWHLPPPSIYFQGKLSQKCGNCSDQRLNFLVLKSKPKAAWLIVLKKSLQWNYKGLLSSQDRHDVRDIREVKLHFFFFSWPAPTFCFKTTVFIRRQGGKIFSFKLAGNSYSGGYPLPPAHINHAFGQALGWNMEGRRRESL